MRIVSRGTIRDFITTYEHGDEARGPLLAWFAEAAAAQWQMPADVKAQYRNASVLKGGRVVFNIGGNKFRLVAAIHFNKGIVFIRFIGTHREYDAIDANTI